MQISKNKTLIKYSLKLLALAILAYIIFDLSRNENLKFSFDFFKNQDWTISRLLILFPVFILMFLNWLLESKKWQLLTNNYYPLSIRKAFTSVWSGVSTALFTPNRIGDFIGRISHLPKGFRKKGMISSFYGSYSQWLLTIIMGWMAWIQLGSQLVDSKAVFQSISIAYFLLIIALIVLFLGKGMKIKLSYKWRKYMVHRPDVKTRVKLIGLSLFRYMVFTAQFYLLLRLMGVDLNYGLVFSKLGLFYLLTSLIPSTFWGELGIKESLAVWVFSGLIINSLAVICASLLLWLINLFIPAVIGNYFLYKGLSKSS